MPNPTTIANRYQIQREIGRGGAGVVYAVKHLHTGERLAMKVLLSHAVNQPDIVQRFRREMQASARVRSEHVVRVTDADVAPELKGAPFLIMELLNGADLGRLVTERGACPKDEVLWILGQAARGLDRAHEAGIVHRDLKPENLFLHLTDDKRLIVKLLDFGIARMTDGSGLSTSEARMTRDGAILGTPLFLTPEQALGETEKIGPMTDVWPMGLIAHELLTGASYWAEEQMTTLLAKIIFKPMLAPSAKGVKLGPRFDEWFLRACAREPSQRWPSVGEQVAALADAMEVDHAILTAPEPPPALRDWLFARMKRAESAKGPELSLDDLAAATGPERPRPSMTQSETLEVDYTPVAAPSQPVAVESARKKRLPLAVNAIGAALVTILLILGAIVFSRGHAVAPPPPAATPSPTADLSLHPATVPPIATAAPTATAATPDELEVPSAGSHHGSRHDRSTPGRHHVKKHSTKPTDYEPMAP